MQGGWITLSRNLPDHWLWKDAVRLQWWLDLLYMASWDDEKQVVHDTHLITLHRGQMIASVSFLAERWMKNHKTVLKFVKQLEYEGMISRKVMYRQTSILTICNYENYQFKGDYNIVEDEQNYDIIKIENLKNESIWLESMAMLYGFSSTQEIFRWIDIFALNVQCRDVKHSNLRDAKRHFCDWLRIQLDNQKNQNNNGNHSDKYNQRRGSEVRATSAKDFEGTF